MNIKRLIIPVGSFVIIIIALIISVALLNAPKGDSQDSNTTPAPQSNSSLEQRINEADAAYRNSNFSEAIHILEEVRTAYQDQNKKREADETNDRIESIKALQNQQKQTNNADKTPAPTAEQ